MSQMISVYVVRATIKQETSWRSRNSSDRAEINVWTSTNQGYSIKNIVSFFNGVLFDLHDED